MHKRKIVPTKIYPDEKLPDENMRDDKLRDENLRTKNVRRKMALTRFCTHFCIFLAYSGPVRAVVSTLVITNYCPVFGPIRIGITLYQDRYRKVIGADDSPNRASACYLEALTYITN